jgi:hypothetical protein
VHIDRQGDMAASKATVSEPGWYAFFDCDLLRIYYGYLGEDSWEHVTWKRPHEQGVIVNGSVGEIVTAVSWKRPKIPDAFVKVKIDRLVERLEEFDNLMGKVKTLVGSSVQLPEFLSFKEYIAGLLGVPIHGLIATHRNKKEGSHDDRATRHISRLMLTTPSVPLDLDDGDRPLTSIEMVETDSSSGDSREDDDEDTETSSSDSSSSEGSEEEEEGDGGNRIEQLKDGKEEKGGSAGPNRSSVGATIFHVDTFEYASLFEGLDTKSEPPMLKPTVFAQKTAHAHDIARKSTMALLLGGDSGTKDNRGSKTMETVPDNTLTSAGRKEQPAVVEKTEEGSMGEYVKEAVPVESSLEKSSGENQATGETKDQPTPEPANSLTRASTMAVLLEGPKKPQKTSKAAPIATKAAALPTSSLNIFTPEQSKHVAENLARWRSDFKANSKIPRSMKAFFKKEKIPKKHAKSLLLMTVDSDFKAMAPPSSAASMAENVARKDTAEKEGSKLEMKPMPQSGENAVPTGRRADTKVSPFTAKQQKYIDAHLGEWRESFGQTQKIPKSMKAFFKRERLKKGYAKTLLLEDRERGGSVQVE